MLVTCAASFSFGSACTVTVAGWPTLTLLMLDSAIGTSSCIPLRLRSVMNPELLLDELAEPPEAALDPPELALEAPVLPELPEPLEPLDDEAPPDDPPADTESPTPADTAPTVPANGA